MVSDAISWTQYVVSGYAMSYSEMQYAVSGYAMSYSAMQYALSGYAMSYSEMQYAVSGYAMSYCEMQSYQWMEYAVLRDRILSYPEMQLRILQGRVAPEVKSRLYENTEVRYKNALFFISTLHS